MMDKALLVAKDVKHVLTHRTIHADFYLLDTLVHHPLPPGYIWIPESALSNYAHSRLIERLLSILPAKPESR